MTARAIAWPATDRVRTSQRPATAPIAFEPVSPEHADLAQVEREQDEDRPQEEPDGPERVGVHGPEAQREAEQHERLGRPSRPEVEQVEEVGGEHEHPHREQVLAGVPAAAGQRVQGEPE